MGLVRLFLAWVVAIDHWRILVLIPRSVFTTDVEKFGFNAGYAVMFFYVISGFLITFTLTRNYTSDSAGTIKFYRNRFIRIYSLYWPMVLASFITIGGAWAAFLAAPLADKFTNLFILGMDWRISFVSYPTPYFAATVVGLGQAWTLGLELTFYLAAPFLLRAWKVAVALLFASFAARAYFAFTLDGGLDAIWTYHFVGTSFGFFMLGQLICLAARRWPILANPLLGIAFVIASFAFMLYGGSYAVFDGRRLWVSVLLFTVALPGLFEATKNIRWMNRVGDLSYPVYLIHILVFMWFGNLIVEYTLPAAAPTLAQGYASMAVFVLASTIAAWVAHRAVEVPMSHGLQYLFRRFSRQPQPS